MRPLFAIAPLALILGLIGPAPREGQHDRTAWQPQEQPGRATVAKAQGEPRATAHPAMLRNTPIFSAPQATLALDARVQR